MRICQLVTLVKTVSIYECCSNERYEALLDIGQDLMTTDSNCMITLNREFCNVVDNTDYLKKKVYPDLQSILENED